MPFKSRFRKKFASSSPKRICCPTSVRLVHSTIPFYFLWPTNFLLSFPFPSPTVATIFFPYAPLSTIYHSQYSMFPPLFSSFHFLLFLFNVCSPFLFQVLHLGAPASVLNSFSRAPYRHLKPISFQFYNGISHSLLYSSLPFCFPGLGYIQQWKTKEAECVRLCVCMCVCVSVVFGSISSLVLPRR